MILRKKSLDEVRSWLDRITLPSNTTVEILALEPQLLIDVTVEWPWGLKGDDLRPGDTFAVTVKSTLRGVAAESPRQLAAVIQDLVARAWGHELAETFKFDGKCTVDPHPPYLDYITFIPLTKQAADIPGYELAARR